MSKEIICKKCGLIVSINKYLGNPDTYKCAKCLDFGQKGDKDETGTTN